MFLVFLIFYCICCFIVFMGFVNFLIFYGFCDELYVEKEEEKCRDEKLQGKYMLKNLRENPNLLLLFIVGVLCRSAKTWSVKGLSSNRWIVT
jgi:hypothetical protein